MVVTFDLSWYTCCKATGFTALLPCLIFREPSALYKGSVGFHCSAWPIRLLPNPASFVMGGMFSRYWLAITLKSTPSLLLRRNLKLEFRPTVYFLKSDFLTIPC